jgi:hypothetical protein
MSPDDSSLLLRAMTFPTAGVVATLAIVLDGDLACDVLRADGVSKIDSLAVAQVGIVLDGEVTADALHAVQSVEVVEAIIMFDVQVAPDDLK